MDEIQGLLSGRIWRTAYCQHEASTLWLAGCCAARRHGQLCRVLGWLAPRRQADGTARRACGSGMLDREKWTAVAGNAAVTNTDCAYEMSRCAGSDMLSSNAALRERIQKSARADLVQV